MHRDYFFGFVTPVRVMRGAAGWCFGRLTTTFGLAGILGKSGI